VNVTCIREQDVLDVLATGRLPAACDADLDRHIEGCAGCADLLLTAAALLEDRECAWSEASVPPSAVVWWRAQLRAREEAARSAVRPIAFAQGVAASCGLWAAVSILRVFPVSFSSDSWARLQEAVASLRRISAVTEAFPGGGPLLLALGASLLLAPLVLLLALRED
jgi:hypothetical protein